MRMVNFHRKLAHPALYCEEYTSYSMPLSQVYCICVNVIVMSSNPNIRFIELGTAELSRIKNLITSVSSMNNLSPDVTTAYLNGPRAVHMPGPGDPPSPPLDTWIGHNTRESFPPPTPPPTPRMYTPTVWVPPYREKNFTSENRGEYLAKFWMQGAKIPN